MLRPDSQQLSVIRRVSAARPRVTAGYSVSVCRCKLWSRAACAVKYSRPKDFLKVEYLLDVVDVLLPRAVAGLAVLFRHFSQGSRGEGGKAGGDRGGGWAGPLLSAQQPLAEDAKIRESSALVGFADSFLALSPDSGASSACVGRQARPVTGSSSPGEVIWIIRLTTLSLHTVTGKHAGSSSPPLLRFIRVPLLPLRCQRRTAVLSHPGSGCSARSRKGKTLSSSNPSRTVVRPPRGCYSDGRDGRLPLLPMPWCLSDRFKCSHCAKRPLPLAWSYYVQHMAVFVYESHSFRFDKCRNWKGVARIHRAQTCSSEPPPSPRPPQAAQPGENVL